MKYVLLIVFAAALFKTARVFGFWLVRRNINTSKQTSEAPAKRLRYSDFLWPLIGIGAGILAYKFIPE